MVADIDVFRAKIANRLIGRAENDRPNADTRRRSPFKDVASASIARPYRHDRFPVDASRTGFQFTISPSPRNIACEGIPPATPMHSHLWPCHCSLRSCWMVSSSRLSRYSRDCTRSDPVCSLAVIYVIKGRRARRFAFILGSRPRQKEKVDGTTRLGWLLRN